IQSVFSDLMKSQKEYKSLVENSNSIIMKVRPDGVITYCNQFGLDFYGYSEKELIGSRIQDTVLKTNKPEDFKILENIFNQDKRYWNGTNRNITSTGEEVWILWSNTMIFNQNGKVKELLSSGQDFTSRRAAQIALKDSLEEKNILLKEIHHRVKNNLQIINSLVNLQLSDVSNTKVQETLETLQSRIQSMALVHEMLYSSDSLSEIDFHDYISQIISTISATFNNPEHSVNVLLNGDTFYLDIERATTCGLLINEIIINAFKHAFTGRESNKENRIDITLKNTKSGSIEVLIKDNGIGITGLSQTSDTAGMGTLLIDALTDQIGGTIKISKNNGTSVSLVFKNS
ncbi:MAG: PAS domain S-box protein, partial [Spirochaetaceae bacterium]|nr:PAS domain S-box protein [Spirochaetaceae bacterium]